MDGGGHYPHATVEQTASGGVSIVESGDGAGPLVCIDGGESLFSPGAGAQAQFGAPTVAGILL